MALDFVNSKLNIPLFIIIWTLKGNAHGEAVVNNAIEVSIIGRTGRESYGMRGWIAKWTLVHLVVTFFLSQFMSEYQSLLSEELIPPFSVSFVASHLAILCKKQKMQNCRRYIFRSYSFAELKSQDLHFPLETIPVHSLSLPASPPTPPLPFPPSPF